MAVIFSISTPFPWPPATPKEIFPLQMEKVQDSTNPSPVLCPKFSLVMVGIKENRNQKEARNQEEKFDKTEENLVRKGLIHSSPLTGMDLYPFLPKALR